MKSRALESWLENYDTAYLHEIGKAANTSHGDYVFKGKLMDNNKVTRNGTVYTNTSEVKD